VTVRSYDDDVSDTFAFGAFELDVAAFSLRRAGERLKLEKIPMEVLILLVSRRGTLVGRTEITESLWDPCVFVERDCLRCDLSAYPVCLFGKNHTLAVAQCSQSRCDAAESAANDDYIGAKLACGGQQTGQKQKPARLFDKFPSAHCVLNEEEEPCSSQTKSCSSPVHHKE